MLTKQQRNKTYVFKTIFYLKTNCDDFVLLSFSYHLLISFNLFENKLFETKFFHENNETKVLFSKQTFIYKTATKQNKVFPKQRFVSKNKCDKFVGRHLIDHYLMSL